MIADSEIERKLGWLQIHVNEVRDNEFRIQSDTDALHRSLANRSLMKYAVDADVRAIATLMYPEHIQKLKDLRVKAIETKVGKECREYWEEFHQVHNEVLKNVVTFIHEQIPQYSEERAVELVSTYL